MIRKSTNLSLVIPNSDMTSGSGQSQLIQNQTPYLAMWALNEGVKENTAWLPPLFKHPSNIWKKKKKNLIF